MDTPLDNPDMEIFTDGSSFVWDGKRKAGYAMVTFYGVTQSRTGLKQLSSSKQQRDTDTVDESFSMWHPPFTFSILLS